MNQQTCPFQKKSARRRLKGWPEGGNRIVSDENVCNFATPAIRVEQLCIADNARAIVVTADF
jgi:hypothetical protein